MVNKEQFKQNREALGLTKPQLAKELKVSTRHISYIENGDRKPSGVLIRCFELLMKYDYKLYDLYYSQLSADEGCSVNSILTTKGERVFYTEMITKGKKPLPAWPDLKYVGTKLNKI